MAVPIIIVGAARSGTKYLRDILATSTGAAKVPYDINYIWRYRNEAQRDDAMPPEAATAPVAAFVRQQVFRLARVHPNDDIVLFEKTVGTSLRVPFVDRIFPEARYIHLIRDGRAVTESAARQWGEPPQWRRLFAKLRGMPLRNFGYVAWFARNFLAGLGSGRGGGKVWGPRYPGIDADLARDAGVTTISAKQWAASVETATRDLAAIDPARVATVRYEDLVAGDGEIRRLCTFCGLTDADTVAAAHLAKVDRSTGDKWRSAMPPADCTAMLDEIGPLLDRLGYGETTT